MAPVGQGVMPVWHLWGRELCQCGTCGAGSCVGVAPVGQGVVPVWHLWGRELCQCGTCGAGSCASVAPVEQGVVPVCLRCPLFRSLDSTYTRF